MRTCAAACIVVRGPNDVPLAGVCGMPTNAIHANSSCYVCRAHAAPPCPRGATLYPPRKNSPVAAAAALMRCCYPVHTSCSAGLRAPPLRPRLPLPVGGGHGCGRDAAPPGESHRWYQPSHRYPTLLGLNAEPSCIGRRLTLRRTSPHKLSSVMLNAHMSRVCSCKEV